jgi:hypothetical protein
MRKRAFDSFKVLFVQLDIDGACILFEAGDAACPRNWNSSPGIK